MVFNVDPTDGTPLVCGQPLVNALDVEQMHAGQAPNDQGKISHVSDVGSISAIPNILVVLKLAQTNCALLSAVFFRCAKFNAFIFVRESVSLDNGLSGAPID